MSSSIYLLIFLHLVPTLGHELLVSHECPVNATGPMYRKPGFRYDIAKQNKRRYVEVTLVGDYEYYVALHGRNPSTARNYFHHLIETTNFYLHLIDVHMYVTAILFWTDKDEVPPGFYIDDRFDGWAIYAQSEYHFKYRYDVAILVSGKFFPAKPDGSVVLGLAAQSKACNYAVAHLQLFHGPDRMASIESIGSTLAHEIGHTIGMYHDEPHCTCGGQVRLSNIQSILTKN